MAYVKRGRGRPAIAEADRPKKATAKLTPDVHAAWQASGRTLNELVRAGLTSLGAL